MGLKGKLFGKYLLVTNTVSCGLMMGVGDIIQQSSEYWKRNHLRKYFPSETSVAIAMVNGDATEKNDSAIVVEPSNDTLYEHNYMRTKNMITVGLLQGPFHHCFYNLLERLAPGRKASSVVKKTFLDQLIASPTCLGIFFIGLGILERRKVEEVYNELRLKLVDTWKVDCCFWPPTQCINFVFIPLHYRVLYTNLMTMFYDIFLSYMKYDSHYE